MTIASSVLEFALAAGLLTMLPGPDTAVVLTTAVRAGRSAARRAALGVGAGLLFWGLAAGLGLSAVLRATGEYYAIFKFACAGYLIFLAIQCFQSVARRSSNPESRTSEPGSQLAVVTRLEWGFRRAFLTAALNPKLGIFFVAFLPHFIPAGVSPFAMTVGLSAVQAAEAVSWYFFIGAMAAGARNWLSRVKVRRAFDATMGAVFLALGIVVAADKSI